MEGNDSGDGDGGAEEKRREGLEGTLEMVVVWVLGGG